METFGQRLKKLRTGRTVTFTQEKIAEQLGITAQAVSRWETDTALPDITLLVPLAHLFGVSTDYLLGCDVASRGEQIDALVKGICGEVEGLKCGAADKHKYKIAKIREALGKYPGDYRLSLHLAMSLKDYARAYRGEGMVEVSAQAYDEALGICAYIVDNCNDSRLRYRTITLQCVIARLLRDERMLKAFAANLPEMSNSVEYILMDFSLDDRTRAENARKVLSVFCNGVVSMMQDISGDTNEDGSPRYTLEERVELLCKAERLLSVVYEKNEERAWGSSDAFMSRYLAATFLDLLGRGDEADALYKRAVDDVMWGYEHPDWLPERSLVNTYSDSMCTQESIRQNSLDMALNMYANMMTLERPACRAEFERMEKALRESGMI